MSQKDKLIKKLRSMPKDFTYDEALTLLNYFDYQLSNKGKTSGSRVIFFNPGHRSIVMHKPHPQKELKTYQLKELLEILEEENLI